MQEAQRRAEANRTPIIALWGLLLVPLQGEVTDRQAVQLTEEVLARIQRYGARGMVIDLSAMWMVDSHLCAVLGRLANSAKLMGTRTMISGMTPDIALTLQSMGVEFHGVESALGLEEAVELLLGVGRPVSPTEDSNALIDSLLADAKPAERTHP